MFFTHLEAFKQRSREAELLRHQGLDRRRQLLRVPHQHQPVPREYELESRSAYTVGAVVLEQDVASHAMAWRPPCCGLECTFCNL